MGFLFCSLSAFAGQSPQDTLKDILPSSSGWQDVTGNNSIRLVRNLQLRQTVLISYIPTEFPVKEFNTYLEKVFIKNKTFDHSHNLDNFGFHPTNLNVSLDQFQNHKLGNWVYEMPVPDAQVTVVNRLWMGTQGLWQLTMIHEGRAALRADDQEKFSNSLMQTIISLDEKKAGGAASQIFLKWLEPEAKAENEYGTQSPAGKSNSGSGPSGETFWKKVSPEECKALNLPEENQQKRPPYNSQVFTPALIGEQCGRGVGRGLVKFGENTVFLKNFEQAAQNGGLKQTDTCGPFPQQGKNENVVDYDKRTNDWNSCTLVRGIQGTAGDIANQLTDFAGKIGGGVWKGVTHPDLAVKKAGQLESSVAQWFWANKTPTEALLFFCHEVKGFSCMNPEAQTRAMCACLSGSVATAGSMGVGALSNSEKIAKLGQSLKEGKVAAEAVILGKTAARAVKMTPKVSEYLGAVDEFRAATGNPGKLAAARGRMLALADGLKDDSERLAAAEKLLGRKLTRAEQDAVLQAHYTGLNEGRGFGTFSFTDLKEKVASLKKANFSGDTIRKDLMETGLTGGFSDDARNAELLLSDAERIGTSAMKYRGAAEYFITSGQPEKAAKVLEEALSKSRSFTDKYVLDDREVALSWLRKTKGFFEHNGDIPGYREQAAQVQKTIDLLKSKTHQIVTKAPEIKPEPLARPATTPSAVIYKPGVQVVPDSPPTAAAFKALREIRDRAQDARIAQKPAEASKLFEQYVLKRIDTEPGFKFTLDFNKCRECSEAFEQSLRSDGTVAVNFIKRLSIQDPARLNEVVRQSLLDNDWIQMAHNPKFKQAMKSLADTLTDPTIRNQLFDTQRDLVRRLIDYTK